MPRKLDPEIKAIQTMVRTLTPLSQQARLRVLRWLDDRIRGDIAKKQEESLKVPETEDSAIPDLVP